MASPSSRILVTGAGGFTGRHLCAHLRDHGARVLAMVEHPVGDPDEIVVDLLDRAAVEAAVRDVRPDGVVHLAAVAFPGHAEAEAIYRVNLEGTLVLLEALVKADAGHGAVLLPSTGTVYAQAGDEPLTESAPVAPVSHYAVSKLAMEHMARLFANRLPLCIVRPFNYTGPGQREPYLVPKLVRHFATRAPVIELGNVDVERDFLDVRTVVDAYRRLLAAPEAWGRTLNLCSERGTTVRGLVAQLAELTGHRIEIRVNPQFVRVGEPQRIVGSCAQLRAVIGELRAFPLATTLRDMLG